MAIYTVLFMQDKTTIPASEVRTASAEIVSDNLPQLAFETGQAPGRPRDDGVVDELLVFAG